MRSSVLPSYRRVNVATRRAFDTPMPLALRYVKGDGVPLHDFRMVALESSGVAMS